jgi:hypothetical protein
MIRKFAFTAVSSSNKLKNLQKRTAFSPFISFWIRTRTLHHNFFFKFLIKFETVSATMVSIDSTGTGRLLPFFDNKKTGLLPKQSGKTYCNKKCNNHYYVGYNSYHTDNAFLRTRSSSTYFRIKFLHTTCGI